MRRLFYIPTFLLALCACLPPFRGPSPVPLPNPLDGHHWRLEVCVDGVRCIIWIESDGTHVRGPYAPQYAPAWCHYRPGDLYIAEGDFHTVLLPPPFCP